MTMKRKTLLLIVLLVVQCLCIGWLILRYECVVSLGTEVRFPCQAFDPYDAFRGRYLRTQVQETCPCTKREWQELAASDRQYAKIEPLEDGTGLYHVVRVAKEPSVDGLWVLPESVFQALPLPEWDEEGNLKPPERTKNPLAGITFPEKLFVNEKVAPEADKVLAENSDKAVAVYHVWKHKVVLVDIEIDGTPIRELVKAKQ